MANRRESGRRRGPDPLARRIGRDPVRMLGLDREELAKQSVVLLVAARRRIEHVVLVGELLELGAQLREALAGAPGHQLNRRKASGEPARNPAAASAL